MSSSTKLNVPVKLVSRMKDLPNGITPEIEKLKQFGIDVNFDGKEKVELIHKHGDLLEIAVNTLEREYPGHTGKDYSTVVEKTLKDGKIVWKLLRETAWKTINLCRQEMDQLTKIGSVQIKPTLDSKDKFPASLMVSFKVKDFEKANALLKTVTEKCEKIKPLWAELKRKDITKARKFCKEFKKEDAFCCFDEAEEALKIYCIKEEQSIEILKEWKMIINGNKGTKSQPSTSNSQDKLSTSMKQTAPDKSNRAGNKSPLNQDQETDKSGTPRAETSSPVNQEPNTEGAGEPNHKQGPSTLYPEIPSAPDVENSVYVNLKPGREADGKYEFVSGPLKIFVYKKSITEIKGMDGIVNAANERMMHGGGVAYFISKAAGKKMDRECNDYIGKHGSLKVTENYVSTAGDMKCKGIIHAVGPQWHDYRGRRVDCAKDVYATIMNCLEAMKPRKWSKLALVAISSGIFGVPKQLCAEMYVKALVDYGVKDPGSVREVHFIDLNPEILSLIIHAHKSWVSNPDAISFNNAQQYQEASSMSGTRHKKDHVESVKADQPLVLFIENTRRGKHYWIAGLLELYVYTGSVLELRDMDAVVCSMDTQFDGVLLGKFIDHIPQLRDQIKKNRRPGKDKEVFVYRLNQRIGPSLISVVIENYIQDTTPKDLKRLHEYYANIIKAAEDNKIAKFAMPLVGCGYANDSYKCCSQLISTILTLCKENREKPHIKEVHLVNNDHKFTKYLEEALQEVAMNGHDGASPHSFKGAGSMMYDQGDWTLHTPMEEIPVTMATQQKTTKKQQTKVETQTAKSTMKSSVKTSPEKPLSMDCHYTKNCKQMAVKQFECGHAFCKGCAPGMTKGCKVCLKEGKTTPVKDTKPEASTLGKQCPVCLEKYPNLESLPCHHELCTGCLTSVKKHKPACPVCMQTFGTVTGDQPDGTMHYRTVPEPLPGYKEYETIEMKFTFLDGIQKTEHPNPGTTYKGTMRRAFLPNTSEGQNVLRLLRRAFDRKLIFTVGTSRSTGKDDRVTYNDIHLKTKTHGGPTHYGYPDEDYLSRVLEELKNKGVTE